MKTLVDVPIILPPKRPVSRFHGSNKENFLTTPESFFNFFR